VKHFSYVSRIKGYLKNQSSISDWGSDIFYPLTGTTQKWPESFNNADFGHFTD